MSKMSTRQISSSRLPKRGKSAERRRRLSELDYFHHYIPREEVEPLLPRPGDFLIRESVMADKRAAIILSVRTNQDVKHFPAEFNSEDNMFYFTEGVGKPNIVELIEYHLEQKIPIRDCTLVKPVGRTKWEILDEQIQFEEKVLGEGNFAIVRRGKYLLNGQWVNMACKKLKMERCRSKHEKDKIKFQMVREFQIGRLLHGHRQILTVHGLYVGSEELALVMELCDGGALDKYMETNTTEVYEKIHYLVHAAGGLSHMHKLNLIHRDVASRNFLLVKRENLLPLLKVADFGLTRPGPTYLMTTEHEVPYLISALECLVESPVWTPKSDCWSFGVLMWHLFDNCRSEPYADLLVVNSNALKELLVGGTRLKPQSTMPAELQHLMAECFNIDPKKRPEMSQIHKRLLEALKKIWNEPSRTQ